MKKLVCIVLAIVMTLALAACASAEFRIQSAKLILFARGASAAALTPRCARWLSCSRASSAFRLRL